MPQLFEEHEVLAVLQDGRVIATGTNRLRKDYGEMFTGGCETLNIRVPDLRAIEYVIHVQLHYYPMACYYPLYTAVNKKITGNVVGITIFGRNQISLPGVTLTAEVIAVGPP